MATSGFENIKIILFVFLLLHGVASQTNGSSNTGNVSNVVPDITTYVVEITTPSGKADMTTVDKESRIINFIPGVVLDVVVAQWPWHEYTIQFNETLLTSWLTCLNSEYTSNCSLDTEYAYGSAYVHTAKLTSNVTSNTASSNIFTCTLENLRYVQEKGEIMCTRSDHQCMNIPSICKMSNIEASAVFQWDESQSAIFNHDPKFVNRSCGDVCVEVAQHEGEKSADTLSVTYIWVIVGIVGGVLLISLIVLAVVLCRTRRHKKKKGSKNLNHESDQVEIRSSRFSRVEDPSDDLHTGHNNDVTVEMSEVDRKSKSIAENHATENKDLSTGNAHQDGHSKPSDRTSVESKSK